jgi:uncharacterized protein (DUF1501 family)
MAAPLPFVPTRRGFLGSALGLSAGALAARWPLATSRPRPERSLVVLQLTGGNDGLSTVVPFAADGYARARPSLRFGADEVLAIEPERGLHPLLRGFRQMYRKGYLAIVEGVGLPGPTLSHFEALERWHTADPRGRVVADGWLGRLAAALDPGSARPLDPLHLGPNAPYAVYSRERLPTCLDVVERFERVRAPAGLERYIASVEDGEVEPLARLRRVLRSARDASAVLQAAVREYETPVEYPPTPLGRRLRAVAALIEAGVGARLFSLEHGNFDTHGEQRFFHDQLMGELDATLSAFLRDLLRSEAGRETLVLAFSEFGRRVAENASIGTDHGTAGPVLLFGARVAPGLHGQHPSLEDLDEGNLRVEVDQRAVYAAVAEGWFGLPRGAVLGAELPRLELFAG